MNQKYALMLQSIRLIGNKLTLYFFLNFLEQL